MNKLSDGWPLHVLDSRSSSGSSTVWHHLSNPATVSCLVRTRSVKPTCYIGLINSQHQVYYSLSVADCCASQSSAARSSHCTGRLTRSIFHSAQLPLTAPISRFFVSQISYAAGRPHWSTRASSVPAAAAAASLSIISTYTTVQAGAVSESST